MAIDISPRAVDLVAQVRPIMGELFRDISIAEIRLATKLVEHCKGDFHLAREIAKAMVGRGINEGTRDVLLYWIDQEELDRSLTR